MGVPTRFHKENKLTDKELLALLETNTYNSSFHDLELEDSTNNIQCNYV